MKDKGNCSLEQVANFISQNDNFLICGHVRPDGDSNSSSMALYNIVLALKKKSHALICSDKKLNSIYDFLANSKDFINTSQVEKLRLQLNEWNLILIDGPIEAEI